MNKFVSYLYKFLLLGVLIFLVRVICLDCSVIWIFWSGRVSYDFLGPRGPKV